MEIRNYAEGDKTHIVKLFELAFGKKLSPEFWSWRFEQNILARKMIKLMWDGGELVGHYALSPVELEVDGAPVLSALSMTTMTHPAYAGKGVFTTLASELFEEQSRTGLKIVWGFPNANSHPGFISKLNWRDVGIVPVLSASAEGIRKHASLLAPIVKFAAENILAYRASTESYRVKVRKTEAYLNWRYFGCPGKDYAVFEIRQNGIGWYIVSKLFKSESGAEIDVVELSSPKDPAITASLLCAALAFWEKTAKVSRFNMWLPLCDVRHVALEKMGFVNQMPITYLGARAFPDAGPQHAIANFNNWMLSMGDSDVF